MKRHLDFKISQHFEKYKQKAVNKAFKNRYPEAKVRLVTADNFY